MLGKKTSGSLKKYLVDTETRREFNAVEDLTGRHLSRIELANIRIKLKTPNQHPTHSTTLRKNIIQQNLEKSSPVNTHEKNH